MNKKQIKFIFAPFGVLIGISVFITTSNFISKWLQISDLSSLFSFPVIVFTVLGIILFTVFFPIFIAGIVTLKRRGAVGQSETLRKTGIYNYVRNPMYSGISLTIISFGFLLNKTSLLIAGVLWFIITIFQCKREEKELYQRFGKGYLEYKAKTPMFFPNLLLIGKDLFGRIV